MAAIEPFHVARSTPPQTAVGLISREGVNLHALHAYRVLVDLP